MESGLVQNISFNKKIHGLSEYLLVVCPDKTVKEQLIVEKQLFYTQFAEPVSIQVNPFIEVAGFLAKEEMEETIIRWMHRIISAQKKFRVTLDRFNGIEPHTIFLRVQNQQPFQQLTKELLVVDEYVKSYGCPEMCFIKRPHITIAEQLSEAIYRKAESIYATRNFQASFEVNELILLRKQPSFEGCKQVNVFGLQP